MLKELIMKVMGFERISFGNTELYFPKKINEEIRLVLNNLSNTDPTHCFIITATNPQDYDKPHTILVLQSSNFGAHDLNSLENAFDKVVKKSWES